MDTAKIDISVVIPCRNEEKYIRNIIRIILSQEGLGVIFNCEVLVVDGKSDDGTEEIVREESTKNPSIKLIVNEKKVTPSAFNLGIKNATGRYVCILGAHSEISDDYLLNSLETIEKVDADNVGGPWRVRGVGYVGEAIALAFQHPYSSGLAKGHDINYEGYLDTVWGGFYKREVFDKIGLFDEELIRNQDDELNYRLVKSGGKIWQSPKIKYHYICRSSLKRLFFQYLQYGFWKVRVIQKHGQLASIRHIVPALFVASLFALGFVSIFSSVGLKLFCLLICLYGAVTIFSTLLVCKKPSFFKYMPVLPVIFATYHVSYGLGFLCGLIDMFISGKRNNGLFTRITR